MDNQTNIEDKLKETLSNRKFEVKAAWQADIDAKLNTYNSRRAGYFKLWMLIPLLFIAAGSYAYLTSSELLTYSSESSVNSSQRAQSKDQAEPTSYNDQKARNSSSDASIASETANAHFIRETDNNEENELNNYNKKKSNLTYQASEVMTDGDSTPDSQLVFSNGDKKRNLALQSQPNQQKTRSNKKDQKKIESYIPRKKPNSGANSNLTDVQNGIIFSQGKVESVGEDLSEKSFKFENSDLPEKIGRTLEFLQMKNRSLPTKLSPSKKLTALYIPVSKRKKLKTLELYTGISNSRLQNYSYQTDVELNANESISNLNSSLLGLRLQLENTLTTGLELTTHGEVFSSQDTTFTLTVEDASFYQYEYENGWQIDSMLVDSIYVIDSTLVQMVTDSALIMQMDSTYSETISNNSVKNRYTYLNIPLGYEFNLVRSSKLRLAVTPEIYLGIRVKQTAVSYQGEKFEPKSITFSYGGRISAYYNFNSRLFTATHLNFRNHLLNTDSVFDRKYMTLSGHVGLGIRF